MGKLVVINLGSGNLQSGFPNVTAQIFKAMGDRYPTKSVGSLAPVPELEQLYRHWQLLYREFYRERTALPTRAIEIEESGLTHFSELEFNELAEQLKVQLNAWLNSESFHSIDRRLSRELDPAEEIRVIIETNDSSLRRIPWHLWNFFEDYQKAEVALGVQEYGQIKSRFKTPVGKVRILAVLGHSNGIDVQADRQLLREVPGVDPLFLEEPSLQTLNEHLWDTKGWDILFFAGHSQSDSDTGRIYINQSESLTLEQLRHALKKAINRGLKLAIFNSCDGLGVAQSLADLHIPQVIVMRELVPDTVAQEFFKYFLTAFSSGQSLYLSIREAREKLEKLEGQYPYATWLPVICQNPAEALSTWQSLRNSSSSNNFLFGKRIFAAMLIASSLATAFIMQVRQLGMLERWELQEYDQLMRLRPAEPLDSRILIVTVTEKDVQAQPAEERLGASISDRALDQLLEKLQRHQPSAIGLDIYRDFPIDAEQVDTNSQLYQNEKLIAICEVGRGEEHPGTPIFHDEFPINRQSFSDIPVDPDSVIRRQILGMATDPASNCTPNISFSLNLAKFYLADKNISVQRNSAGDLQIGEVLFPRLGPQTGGYHQLDDQGYQVLLNYRDPGEIAEKITLAELNSATEDKLAGLITDRIVIIGTTAQSFKDYSPTPYSTGGPNLEEVPGVVIQAHMVSQILSAVLDGRPLLWWFPQWGNVLWVGGWSLMGGILVLCIRSPLKLWLVSMGAIAALYGVCFVFLIKGGWLPLVPAALAFGAAEGGFIAYLIYQDRSLK